MTRTSSAPTTHLLYLHGFRSSPESSKARAVAERVASAHPKLHWWCPQLPPSPCAAMDLLDTGIAAWPKATMAVIGSSLGGFYATNLAARTGCKAVLLNPAIDPARNLAAYIGEQTQWHEPDARFYFRPEYIAELRALEVGPLPDPQRVMAIIAKGDEVLDWREMSARHAGSRIELLEGGDHALSDFDLRHLDSVMAFIDPV